MRRNKISPRLRFAVFSFLFLGVSTFWMPPASSSGEEKLFAPAVQFFSPQGTVKNIRQVSARFSEAMVPFGDPGNKVEPFEVRCSEKGASRWMDPKNWIFDFDRDLPGGVKCEFILRDGIKTLAGKDLAGQKQFVFNTGGPSVRSIRPYDGDEEIDEEQVFILTLDAEADEAAILSGASFLVEGLASPVGVKVLQGEERKLLISAISSRRRFQVSAALTTVLIQARQKFPAEAKIRLVWGKGVGTRNGIQNDKDQTFAFKVRAPFTATFHCERENANGNCVPVSAMSVDFSSRVPWEIARKIVLKGSGGKSWPAEEGGQSGKAPDEPGKTIPSVVFSAPFPESETFTVEIPKGIKDDAGRLLKNRDKYPLTVKTVEFPPLAKFSASFGILELKGEPVLPVSLRNLEPEVKARLLKIGGSKIENLLENLTGKFIQVNPEKKEEEIISWMQKMYDHDSHKISVFGIGDRLVNATEFSIPKPNGPKAFELVGLPLKDPGFYVVELKSPILGKALSEENKDEIYYVPTSALVTNLSVHFKRAGNEALVWVTTLDAAEPVKEAKVTVRDCSGARIAEGQTDASGVARLAKLPPEDSVRKCSGYGPMARGLYAMAESGGDISFVHTSWNEGIEPWRFQLPTGVYLQRNAGLTAHTVFDRTLFRAGETVHMKHIFRNKVMTGFNFPDESLLPKVMMVHHEGSDQEFEVPLSWDNSGLSDASWSIPKEAKLGLYQVSLGKNRGGFSSGSFRVEEFRVPLMRGAIHFPAGPLVGIEETMADLSVAYLAGGGAEGLPVRFRTRVEPKSVSFDDYDGFIFANGIVSEKKNNEVSSRAAASGTEYGEEGELYEGGESEGSGEDAEDGAFSPVGRKKKVKYQTRELTLDRTGGARAVLPGLPKLRTPGRLEGELEYRDPNGEVQTVSSSVTVWPADRVVGLKPDSWALSMDGLKFKVVVLDTRGKPVEGAPVKVDLFEHKNYSHRKRLMGGFYAYENYEEIRRVKTFCEGKTAATGLLLCEAPVSLSGEMILSARTVDSAGRESGAHSEVWVAGKGEWWFSQGDSDRIDLIPEKKHYEPGETARIQVRMPFREATALITIEREGITRPIVKKISGRSPVIEVPIEGNFAPNIFVSVLAIRGRVGDVQPTALVDLGRPAYKLGIVELNVGWKAHELKVKVAPDKEVYRVRSKAKVVLSVSTADGKPLPAGSEVLVAAVDEGLLELRPNNSWNLLQAMMGQRTYDVETMTAQMHVIGKRHFGLKALPHGGDGGGAGRGGTRELFDTLLLWKGRVTLDGKGEAVVEVPVNDSLTSFKIAVVATSGPALFGTGFATIRSSQELMLFSGIPPLVRGSDRFKSGFTVRNSGTVNLDVNLTLKVTPLKNQPAPLKVSLAPGSSREVHWDIEAPPGPAVLSYELAAEAPGGISDRIRVKQTVITALPVRIYQATLVQLDKTLHLPVERPSEALGNQGGIRALFRSRLSSGLEGVTEYMRAYPYRCLEQQVSRAVALRDLKLWAETMAALPAYLDSDGLAKYFPLMEEGSEILTAYLVSVADEAGWEIPAYSKEAMLKGLLRFVRGALRRKSVLQTADQTLRKLMVLEALSRADRAKPSDLTSLEIEPNLWPTSSVIDWFNILQRVEDVPDRDARLKEAAQILRSRLNFQGTALGFSTDRSDYLWWLMVSSDVNASRLILSLLKDDSGLWKEDLPRIVSGTIGRQRRGAWDLTVANAWGVLAMEKFSSIYEKDPVGGISSASLEGKKEPVDWKATAEGKSVEFSWPAGKAEVTIDHTGTGKPWLTFQSLAAIPLKAPISTGYKIKKTVSPVEQKVPGKWSRGDVLRVRLELEAEADRTWVVVNDPVPGGATLLGTGLGNSSRMSVEGEKRKGWVWPAFEERSFEAYRGYFEWVPKGEWMVEYTVRLNNEGDFILPSTRVEAMYSPEMFGEIPNAPVSVGP